jgi:hypothetical protein
LTAKSGRSRRFAQLCDIAAIKLEKEFYMKINAPPDTAGLACAPSGVNVYRF